MSEIHLNIDGIEVVGFEGQTILEIARNHGIEIPTLCHDEKVQMYGSCGLCVVEAEGSPKLLRACSTYAADRMVIRTDSPRVQASRKTALELLLSDHDGDCRPPCMLACPAGTDCQGYVGLIANGEHREALKLIKEKIPLPASIGRVCPHPCETACRRQLVEEPVSIASLKQFIGDMDLADGDLYTGAVGTPTGKSVAVIGGGPGGLSMAYFLRQMGHAVTVIDAMPDMGGMLRYGIPEYRLAKALLARECDAIRDMGVTFVNNVKIGRDMTLDYLRENYDAVVVAVGAWTSVSLGCPGEELDGVIGGIDFLRKVALTQQQITGRNIAVVGGGNTAMDACRTAIRLGAANVYNIYRRTKNEMPAEAIEIEEAEEEGVVFRNLTNPEAIVGENGAVTAIRLQLMELGEPDASGRRAPVPIAGKTETVAVDTVIVAIGQTLDPSGLEVLTMTKRKTVAADEHTFCTNVPGVFAIGDATNKGADIAVSAIGEAGRAAQIVNQYLNSNGWETSCSSDSTACSCCSGEALSCEEPYYVKSEKTAEDFSSEEKKQREPMPHRSAESRRHDFLEINHGFSEEAAKREAARCLECGCHDYFECKLIRYANDYRVQPEKYNAKTRQRRQEEDHPFIHRNPDKCILCGLCVRVCDEVVGATALGLVDRGFQTIVKPALNQELRETDCISCGQCVSVCPTGALTETMMLKKQVPTQEKQVASICSFCSVGCGQNLTVVGGSIARSLPDAADKRNALLCVRGRFGFGEIGKLDRLNRPQIGETEVGWDEAYLYTNKKFLSLVSQYGSDSVAVTVSDRYTNEEADLIRQYAKKVLKTDLLYSMNVTPSGLRDVTGVDASTCTVEELENSELIVVVASDIMKNHAVAGLRIRKAVIERGAKLVLLDCPESLLDDIAAETIRFGPNENVSGLAGIVKALLESSDAAKQLPGYETLAKSLSGLEAGAEAKHFTEMYLKAKKAVVVFEKNSLSADAARLIGDIALLGGHLNGPRNGIIQLLPGANTQGLVNLGYQPGSALTDKIADGTVKGLFIFGEQLPPEYTDRLEFLAVQELFRSETAQKADIVFPGTSYMETEGSFTSADGRVQAVRAAIRSATERGVTRQLTELAGQAKVDLSCPHEVGQKCAAKQSTAQKFGAPVTLCAAGSLQAPLHTECISSNALQQSFNQLLADTGVL